MQPENRAVPTIPFRRIVNFSEANLWCYFLSQYSERINCQHGSNTIALRPGKHTFDVKGFKTISIKGIDDKHQITAIFAISMCGEFLSMQVICEGKTTRCLPKCALPENFDITFTENYWSNTEKAINFF